MIFYTIVEPIKELELNNHVFLENEIVTAKELVKKGITDKQRDRFFKQIAVSKQNTYWFFGMRKVLNPNRI